MEQFNQFKTLEVGKGYTMTVPNGRQTTINVVGDFQNTHDLFITLTKTADLPDPQIKPISGNQVRIFWPREYNVTTRHRIKVHNRNLSGVMSRETEKAVVSIWSRLSDGTKRAFKITISAVAFAWLAGTVMHVDTKYNNNKLQDFLNPSSWFKEKISYTDKIMTNDWDGYKTSAFIAMAEEYRDDNPKSEPVQDLYRSVDGKSFMMKDLVRNEDGSYKKLNWADANDYCEKLGGWIPGLKDQKELYAGSIAGFENFAWPINLFGNIPEWSSDTKSTGWFSNAVYVNLKNTEIEKEDGVIKDKFLAPTDRLYSFRCMTTAMFLGVE